MTRPAHPSSVKHPIMLVLFGAVVIVPSLLAAQDGDYVVGLKTCQAVADDAARLACYDNAVGRVVAASDEGEVRIIDSAEVTETKRGLFGFSLPRIALFEGKDGKADEPLELLQSTITRVQTQGRNTVFLTIADGNAVWRISGASRAAMRTEVGDSVEFKKAALGSYFIRIDRRTGEKGRRVQ